MIAFVAGFGPTGVLLRRHAPRHPVTWPAVLAAASAGGWLLAWACADYTVAGVSPGAWAAQWLLVPSWILLVLTLLRFPDGAVTTGRRRLQGAAVLAGVVATGSIALAALPSPHTIITDPLGPAEPWSRALVLSGAAAALALLLIAVATAILLVRAARVADARARWAYAALVPAAALFVAGALVDGAAAVVDSTIGVGALLTLAGIVAMPVGILVAVLEGWWADLDVVTDRRVVVAGAWLAGAVLVVSVLSLVLPATGTSTGPGILLALGGLVLVLSATHRRLVLAVERWVYGQRDDPAKVVRSLGAVLDSAGDPVEALRRTPALLATSLRLPFASLELRAGGEVILRSDYGRPLVEPEVVDLVVGGLELGTLRVSPRGRGQHLSQVEHELVASVAQHISSVAHAHLMASDVQQARERLVRAREEERLRLRRDLHDGLGPVLAGARMQLSAALSADTTPARSLVEAAAADLEHASRSVREVVEALRPATLESGLAAAIEDAARALLPRHELDLHLPQVQHPLPAATEIAVLRIVTEALTNVARHAGATQCSVTIDVDEQVSIEVSDDGSARVPGRPGGLGLTSMRARAEELGGSFSFDPGPTGSTVRARVPVDGSPR